MKLIFQNGDTPLHFVAKYGFQLLQERTDTNIGYEVNNIVLIVSLGCNRNDYCPFYFYLIITQIVKANLDHAYMKLFVYSVFFLNLSFGNWTTLS